MQQSSKQSVMTWWIVVAGVIMVQIQAAKAGWTGLMNGAGVGWASVNVRSSTFHTNRVTTLPNLASPSAAMSPTTGYKTNAPLPGGAATNTYARIKGLPGGIWQASLNAANSGDGTDNAELEGRVPITPADCASITFGSVINQSQSEFNSNGFSGTISADTSATAGTALWLRGFEYTNAVDTLPPDDPNTPQNETIEYLKTHGAVVFETLLVGPFEFGGTNGSCPLIIPFSLSSGNLSNLVFATDAAAKSNPLQISCPGNIVVTCGQPVVYNPVYYSACGDVTITYNPPEGTAFPVGTTPVVVSVADQNGNSTNCTFTVTVMDITPPVKPTLADISSSVCSSTSITPPTPTTTDDCAGIVTGTTTTPFPITTAGTTVVTWTFNDGNGNITTATQKVTLAGLTFTGFYSPISGTNGTCSAPLRNINRGSNIPIKFDLFCGSTPITAGTPPAVLIQSYSNCVAGTNLVNANAVYQNDWHYNWDTSGWAKGIYKVIVLLPDGTSRYVFVKLV